MPRCAGCASILRRKRTLPALAASALVGLLMLGCSAPAPTNEPRAARWPSARVWDTPDATPVETQDPQLDPLTPADLDPRLAASPFQNRLVANLQQHTFTTDGVDFDPDVARDGEQLVFASTRNAHRPDLYLKRVIGSALTQLTDDGADDIQPRFSPDGQTVAFVSNRAGSWDVWLIGVNGDGLRQLTNDPGDEIAPTWSPDGKTVAYSRRGHPNADWEVWTAGVAESGQRRFLTYGMFPAWSPDGAQLAFQRARERGGRWFSLWTVQLRDGEASLATEVAARADAACAAPSWSPDGNRLAYCAISERDDGEWIDSGLWVLELEQDAHHLLDLGGRNAFNPTWGDDRIFFVSTFDGRENVWSTASPPGSTADRVAAGATP